MGGSSALLRLPLSPTSFRLLPLTPSSYPRPSLLSLVARAGADPQGSAEPSSAPSESTAAEGPPADGRGFGGAVRGTRKKKGRGEREVRRSPVIRNRQLVPNKSARANAAAGAGERRRQQQQERLSVDENAFLLAWLGLGVLIFVEGIALAASGFLPEEWDGFFVKFLYPSFTPTVIVFLGGTVAYGVSKYLQNEKMKN